MSEHTYHIAFEEVHAGLAEHSLPLITKCLDEGHRVCIACPQSELEELKQAHSTLKQQDLIYYQPFEDGITDWSFDALLTTVQNTPGLLFKDFHSPTHVPRIAMRHGLTDKRDQFPAHFVGHPIGYYNCLFATGSVMFKGSWERYIIKHPSILHSLKIFNIGSPKTDILFSGKYDRETILESLGLDPTKKTLLYAPTYQKEASLEQHGVDIIRALAQDKNFNLLVRLHYYSLSLDNPDAHKLGHRGRNWQTIMDDLENEFPNLRHVTGNSNPWFVAADLMVSDVSGACFEYILQDKPIIFFDCPDYFDQHGKDGIGYWGRGIGDIVHTTEELQSVTRTNLSNPDNHQTDRQKLINELVYNKGQATNVAYDTLIGLIQGAISYPTWGPETVLREDRLRTEYIIERISGLRDKEIALYGAGQHASYLLSLIDQIKNEGRSSPKVSAILDDNPADRTLHDIPIIHPEDMDTNRLKTIILATDYFQSLLKKRCDTCFGDSITVIDLYEPFPWYKPELEHP